VKNWQVLAGTAVALWYIGFFFVPRDWMTIWAILPVWLPLSIVAVLSVLAWAAKKLHI
jgi:hypothetical protein